ncbi:MAG: TlpA family protein disulfide reductase [Planctomycetaceae bacterium]
MQEFWATWCGPCLQSMPHISALQNEYADQVQFIGITRENAATVDGFMKKTGAGGRTWSEILTYTIALDQNDATNNADMRAAEQNGIPCAFIVGKSGTVEWIGHPMRIDQPLQQVVDGTWDVTVSRRSFLNEKESAAARQEINRKIWP